MTVATELRSPEFVAGQAFARTLPKMTAAQREQVVTLLASPPPTPRGRRRPSKAVTS